MKCYTIYTWNVIIHFTAMFMETFLTCPPDDSGVIIVPFRTTREITSGWCHVVVCAPKLAVDPRSSLLHHHVLWLSAPSDAAPDMSACRSLAALSNSAVILSTLDDSWRSILALVSLTTTTGGAAAAPPSSDAMSTLSADVSCDGVWCNSSSGGAYKTVTVRGLFSSPLSGNCSLRPAEVLSPSRSMLPILSQLPWTCSTEIRM